VTTTVSTRTPTASCWPTGADRRRLPALALALALAAGAAFGGTGSSPEPLGGRIKAAMSGFTDDLPGSEPKRNKPYATIPAMTLPDPAHATVVIYSHGTSDSDVLESCSAPGNSIPPSLRALTSQGVYIWYVCSQVALKTTKENAGEFIYLRMEEVSGAIVAFTRLGVPLDHIFLAGHSAGGWTSLMLAQEWGGRIGGIIAYAPAFARKRADITRFPFWRKEVMPRQEKAMVSAKSIRALVFAYDRDEFDRPQELKFLTDAYPDAVQLVHYSCDAEHDHMSFIKDCELDRSTEAVREFVLGSR
jgi:hypothetical protein